MSCAGHLRLSEMGPTEPPEKATSKGHVYGPLYDKATLSTVIMMMDLATTSSCERYSSIRALQV